MTASAPGWARALRPHQWLKNLLLFVPLLTSHLVLEPALAGQVLLAAFLFSITASGLYVVNDLVDRRFDQKHPRKKLRPVASGDIQPRAAAALAVGLLTAGLGLALLLLPGPFVLTLAVYAGLSLAYSLHLKQIVVLDVVILAALYALRVIAGGAAIGVLISNWLLAFSIFLFLSLAFVKRYGELREMTTGTLEAQMGRGYRVGDAEVIRSVGPASGYLSVLVLVLYINESDYAADLYQNPTALWLLGPILLFWVTHVWLAAHRGEMHDDPLLFTMKDRASYWAALAAAIVIFIAL